MVQNAVLRKVGSGLDVGPRVRVAGTVGDQRGVAVGHGVALALPRQPGAFLPIQIRHHLLGRIPKIGNCHDFYIVIIQKHTRAQVELVRCIAAPDGDKSGGIFLKFRRIGPAIVIFLRYVDHAGRIHGNRRESACISLIQQRVLRQRQTSRGGHFRPAVVPACSPGVPIGVVRVGGVQLAVYLGVHRQPAIVRHLPIMVCHHSRQQILIQRKILPLIRDGVPGVGLRRKGRARVFAQVRELCRACQHSGGDQQRRGQADCQLPARVPCVGRVGQVLSHGGP